MVCGRFLVALGMTTKFSRGTVSKERFMRVMVTGTAGFIGSAVAMRLLERGDEVVGIDNHNDYYDPKLKEDRLARFADDSNYHHVRADLADTEAVTAVFEQHKPHRVINLAAQAGVGYSIENPMAYIKSNIVGFANILEGCRHFDVEHLVYASSSSVYGANTSLPFSIHQNVDHPLSFYAASKKSNELMAHSYSHLYNLPTTGLRFFTVYGPWGRPDMALFKFTKNILAGKPIKLFNHGHHKRDFTYIDDIVEGIIRVLDRPATPNREWRGDNPDAGSSSAPWRVYNIGNSNPVNLMDYVSVLEEALGKTSEKISLPLQPGDVPDTCANVDDLFDEFGYRPQTMVSDGISLFVEWYMGYVTENVNSM